MRDSLGLHLPIWSVEALKGCKRGKTASQGSKDTSKTKECSKNRTGQGRIGWRGTARD